ncbi:Uma2 family endonuclease [Rhodopirellula sp. JC639]|uniref:Uma2 family endonuclease n=1 Tax=Stieleria mannarensis TaxID=2755585 RepID=UPI001600B6E5|nr:Uma2 family endonuclease [Rhodopirellula sp. JC639]
MSIGSSSETRTVLDQISWDTYQRLADERRGSVPRIVYDRGRMELMSPGRQHEKLASLIGRLIEAYSEQAGIEIDSAASTTFRRIDLERGFEADRAYYIQHAPLMRPKMEVDLSVDPPPDLVVEVEITSSTIRKMELFASMGVPEVWRCDGSQLVVSHLQGDDYVESSSSQTFPGLALDMVESILTQRFDIGENALIATFRDRVSGCE